MISRTWSRTALVCVGLLVGTTATPAAPGPKAAKLTPEDVARAEKAVKDYLDKLKGGDGMVSPIKDSRLETLFPRYAFFFVLYRQYPVARVPPKGLKSANVFVVGDKGKVQLLTAGKVLLTFFGNRLRPAKTEAQMKDVARAYLRLAEHYRQDGFYTFEVMDDATKVVAGKGNKVAQAVATITKGGSGTLTVDLTFDREGDLTTAHARSRIRRGPRPVGAGGP